MSNELRCTVEEFRRLKKLEKAALKVCRLSYAKNYAADKVDDAIRDMAYIMKRHPSQVEVKK